MDKSLETDPTSVDFTLNRMSKTHALDLLEMQPENESAEWKHEYSQRLLEAAMLSDDFVIRKKLYQCALKHEAEARKMNLASEAAASPQRLNAESSKNKDVVLVVNKSKHKKTKKKRKKAGAKKTKEPVTFVLDLTDDEGESNSGKERLLKNLVVTETPNYNYSNNNSVQRFDPVHSPKLQSIDETSYLNTSEELPFDVALDKDAVANSDDKKREPRSAFAHLADDVALIGHCIAGMMGLVDDDDFSCARGSCMNENGSVTSYSCSDWSCGSLSTIGTTARESSFGDFYEPLTYVVNKRESGEQDGKEAAPELKLVWEPLEDKITGMKYFYHRVTRRHTATDRDSTEVADDQIPDGSMLVYRSASTDASDTCLVKVEAPVKPAKPEWVSNMSAEYGLLYYYNRTTRQATWSKPPQYDEQHSKYNAALQVYRASRREEIKPAEEENHSPQDAVDDEDMACSIIEEQDIDDIDDTPIRLLIKRGDRIEVLRIETLTPLDLLEEASLGGHDAFTEMMEDVPDEEEGIEQHFDLALKPHDSNVRKEKGRDAEKKRVSLGPMFRKSMRKMKSIKKGVLLVVKERNETPAGEDKPRETQNNKRGCTSAKENLATSMLEEGGCKPQTPERSGRMNCVLVEDDEDVVPEGESSFDDTPTSSPTKGQEIIYVEE